ncbi:MAG: hypothetical protein UGF89_05930 [Acutalibacteraceae bacterium]|nr:hypothetical protein [Acutalibacteraceae bacterium]
MRIMDSYQKKIEECEDLESLFEIWKEAHLEEKYFKDSFPGNSLPVCFAKNWTNDGFLSENKKDIEILFILKEPNESKSIEKNDFCCKEFWIKNNIHKRISIPRRMFKTARKLFENPDLDQKTWFQQAAVMNLNKRGGYSQCNYKKLKNYVKIYKSFIEKQIEIINPKKIVFLCGNNDETKEIIKILDVSRYEIYYGPHPAKWGSDENFLIEVTKY